MAHFVSIEDVACNPDLLEQMGQFIAVRPPGHVCIPECAEIGGEPESPEMYGRPAYPLDRSFDDGSGETCAACGGPHFDCTVPAEDDEGPVADALRARSCQARRGDFSGRPSTSTPSS